MRGRLTKLRAESTVGRERFGDRPELLQGETYATPGGNVLVTGFDKATVALEYEGQEAGRSIALTWRFAVRPEGLPLRSTGYGGIVGTTADGRAWHSPTGQSWIEAEDDPDTFVPAELALAGLTTAQVHDLLGELWTAAGLFVEGHPERMAAGSLFEAANRLRRDRNAREQAARLLAETDERIADASRIVEALAVEVEAMANERAPCP